MVGSPLSEQEKQHALAAGVDLSRWPIIVSRNVTGEGTPATLRQIETLRNLYKHHPQSYVTVVDGRTGSPPSAEQRKLLSDFRAEMGVHVRMHCRGIAFLITSPLLRGVITAVFWVRPPDAPYKIVGSLEEALAYGTQQLSLSRAAA